MGLPSKALLPTDQQRLLVEAVVAVAAFRIALWVLPYRWVRHWGASPAETEHDGELGCTALFVKRSVRRASRRLPGATCLTQALAARYLLTRRGLTSLLCLGVARDDVGRPQAHAWLEHDGQVLIGAIPDLARFSRLPLSEEEAT